MTKRHPVALDFLGFGVSKMTTASLFVCYVYTCEQRYFMGILLLPIPGLEQARVFLYAPACKAVLGTRSGGAIEGSVSPVGSAEGERPEIVSAHRSVGPAPRGPQAYWANGRGGKRKPFSEQSRIRADYREKGCRSTPTKLNHRDQKRSGALQDQRD